MRRQLDELLTAFQDQVGRAPEKWTALLPFYLMLEEVASNARAISGMRKMPEDPEGVTYMATRSVASASIWIISNFAHEDTTK